MQGGTLSPDLVAAREVRSFIAGLGNAQLVQTVLLSMKRVGGMKNMFVITERKYVVEAGEINNFWVYVTAVHPDTSLLPSQKKKGLSASVKIIIPMSIHTSDDRENPDGREPEK